MGGSSLNRTERVEKELIVSRITVDSKQELLNQLLAEISSPDEDGAVTQRFTRLINDKMEKINEMIEDFHNKNKENLTSVRILEQKNKEIFQCMNANAVPFFQKYIQKRTKRDANERIFNYVQGMKDGINIYSQIKQAKEDGRIIHKALSAIFNPTYFEIGIYETFIARYGGTYHLREMEEDVDEMLFNADITNEYTTILTNYIDSENIQMEVLELYTAGITQGLQLASVCFP